MNEKIRHRNRLAVEKRTYILAISVYMTVLFAIFTVFYIFVGRDITIHSQKLQEPSYTVSEPTDLVVYKTITKADTKEDKEVKEQDVVQIIDDKQDPEPEDRKITNASKMSSLEQALDELMKLTEGE